MLTVTQDFISALHLLKSALHLLKYPHAKRSQHLGGETNFSH